MDSINRFSSVRPSLFPEVQQTEEKTNPDPSPIGNTGIAETADAFENIQPGSPVFATFAAVTNQSNQNSVPVPQSESVDASSVFDLLTEVPIGSTQPNLGGLTQPIDGNAGPNSPAATSLAPTLNDAGVKSPGELVDIDSLTAPDGDFVEMYLGWEQIPMDRQRGVSTSQEDEGIIRIKDRIRQAGDDKKSEDQKSADETESQSDADRDYTDKHLAEPPKWKDNPSPDAIGGGPAWMGNPEAERYIHIPGLNGHSNSHGNPGPDGGGEEPTTPGPKKTHGSGDDGEKSDAAGSDAGNYPFVGEEGTIIHPQVNVGKKELL
jgi:hypothetical protein